MINVPPSTFVHPDVESSLLPRRIRAGQRFFWAIFIAEALLIAGALVVVFNLAVPARAPLTHSNDHAIVRQAIFERLDGSINDPLTDVAPGVTARSSNVRGLQLNGVTYYYYLEGAQNFDPLSRSVVAPHHVDIVLRDLDSPVPLVIYTIVSK